MAVRLDRRVVAVLLAGSIFAFALVLVARAHAGSNNAAFSTFASPTQLTTGETGFVGAKFTPAGKGNSGTATHVTITLTFPDGTSGISVSTCPGTSSVSGLTATCTIGTIHNGQQVKMFATYTAGPSSLDASITGNVVWDVPKGGGATGGQNTAGPLTAPVSVYSSGATFAGKCSFNSSDSVSASDADPTVGKSTSVAFGTVDSTLGFPCTGAQVGVDPTVTPSGHTKGIWTVTVVPLSGGTAANAVLTLDELPPGTNWKQAQLFEISDAADLTLVPQCTSATAPPTVGDACLVNQKKYGRKGVQFFVNVLGTGIDPRFTS
ncbi:MAG: hypothetical protein ACRDM1_00500 [Gaiellaceae bacterium]